MKRMTYVLFCIGFIVASTLHGHAQNVGSRHYSGKPVYNIGFGVMVNGITGPIIEVPTKKKGRYNLRSTFSATVGYASRYGKFERQVGDTLIDGVTVPIFTKEFTAVHGIGIGFSLNNYLKDRYHGLSWHLGITANYYFDEKPQPKTLGVQASIGYSFPLNASSALRPEIGGGLMGSIFRSDPKVDVEGLFFMFGISWTKRL